MLEGELHPLTDREFGLFRELIYKESGIHLSDVKKALLVGRLSRRLRQLGLQDFGAYHDLVKNRGGEELTRMLDAICTNETRFFREPQQFEFLEANVFPHWRAQAEAGVRSRRIRAWSAACSTGEEPYSLAMSLAHHFPSPAGWDARIIASDLSTKVLDQARGGVWPVEKAADIPTHYRKAYMRRGIRTEEGRMRADDPIRSMIDFRQINLSRGDYPLDGPVDLLFCRNVLIYFDAVSKEAVINRLLNRLAPGGILFLGHAESLNGWSHRVKKVGPTAYALLDRAA